MGGCERWRGAQASDDLATLHCVSGCGNDVKSRAKRVVEQIFGCDVLPCEAQCRSSKESIFSRLESFEHAADEELDPCDVLNSTLTELVHCLQAKRSECNGEDYDESSDFCEIQKQVCRYIDTDDELGRRADVIRVVATRAESRLELFYARKLLYSVGGVNVAQGYTQRIRQAASEFPYTDNYVEMIQKEMQVIKELLRSQCSGERMTRVAFCGSGPLPLSGILLSAFANVEVTLVDRDEQAVAVSRKLLRKWEREIIVPPGRVRVMCADVGSLKFSRRAGESDVRCDVVFVAALLSGDARRSLLAGAHRCRDDAPLVVLRSAHGLTARVAYHRARAHGAPRVALVVPARHVMRDGHVVDEQRGVCATHVFHASILNSLEVFAWPRA